MCMGGSLPVPFYNTKAIYVLSTLQILFGAGVFAAGVAALALDAIAAVASVGIWMGILFIIFGAVGIYSAKKKKAGVVIAYLVLNIIGILFGLCTVIAYAMFCLGASFTAGSEGTVRQDTYNTSFAAIAFGGAVTVVFAVAAGFGCSAICCKSKAVFNVAYSVAKA